VVWPDARSIAGVVAIRLIRPERLLPLWLGVFGELGIEDYGVVVWLDGSA
jgi:hypothetical protein